MQHPTFPPTLDGVPEHAQVTETFGFTPASFAVAGFLGLIGSIVGFALHGLRGTHELYMPAGCLVALVAFGLLELLRRRHKTSLARAGWEIGVYRDGQLSDVVPHGQVGVFQLSVLRTIREVTALGLTGPMALLGGLGLFTVDPAFALCALGLGVGASGALVSSIYVRIVCRHFVVPIGGGTVNVVLTRKGAQRVGL